MKTSSYILLAFFVSAFIMESCSRPKGGSNITGGGSGGNTILTVTPEHHGLFVDSCMIYIKYGTLDEPAAGVPYDDSQKVVLIDTTPTATFHLTNGIYYIFGQGYHPQYPPPNVQGGLSCTVDGQSSIIVYLPVYSYTPTL